MEQADLDELLHNSPSVRLLNAHQSSLILGFLGEVFKAGNQFTVPEHRLYLSLVDYLDKHDLKGDEDDEITPFDTLEQKAKKLITKWTDKEYLRNFQDEKGEVIFELTSHTEKTLQWVGSLRKKEFVGTESKFKDIFFKIKELVEYTNEDKDERLSELDKRKVQIESEMSRLIQGESPRVFDDYQIKSRIHDINESARDLLSDFKEVEDNFKYITREIYKKHTDPEQRKGEILGYAFEALDNLKGSEQGKSFYAFWEFLLSRTMQDEWNDLVNQLYSSVNASGVSFEDPFLRRLKVFLHQSGRKVYEANDKMAEKLGRVISEKEVADRLAIKKVINDIKELAIQLEDKDKSELPGLEIIARPGVKMQMEKKLSIEANETPEFMAQPEQAEISLEQMEQLANIFSQVRVDKTELKSNIKMALIKKKQVSLREVLEITGEIENGLAEVMGYFSIARDLPKTMINDQIKEEIPFDVKKKKVIKIPQIVFSK